MNLRNQNSVALQSRMPLRNSQQLLGILHLLFSTSDTSTSKIGFSKSLIAGLVWEAATQKREHNTVPRYCKQERQIVNVVCLSNNYTKDSGLSAPKSTIPCVVGDSVGDRSSQIVTIIPAISRIKSLADLRFSHQFSGSKSPSRAPATRISMSCGKTRRKMYRARRV